MHGNREVPGSPEEQWLGTHREVQGQKLMMNEHGKSDRPIVPEKSPNEARPTAEERMEGRGLGKGNLRQQNAFRTQGRGNVFSAMERGRGVAGNDRGTGSTTLSRNSDNLGSLKFLYSL